MSVTTPWRWQALTAAVSAGFGVRSSPPATSSTRSHRAPSADLADDVELLGQLVQPAEEQPSTSRARPRRSSALHRLDRAERGGTGDRVAAVGATEATGVDGVHDVGAAGHGGQRQAAGDALGRGDEVGDDALVLAGEPVAGAAEAGLDLVGDEEDAVLGAPVRDPLEVAARRTMKPPSPWIGSMITAATLSSPTCAWTWATIARTPRRRNAPRRWATGRGRPSAPGGRPRRRARSPACRACSWRSAPS